MNANSVKLARQFCDQCIWAYQCWITHIKLFDENQNKEKTINKVLGFHERLWYITQQYTVLQICKLHDPAEFKRHKSTSYNLTINYMINYCDWGEDKESINALAAKLDELYQFINPARNKVIAHSDLKTIHHKYELLGKFPENLDVEYFHALQDFANCVHKKWVGCQYPFKDMTLVENDVAEYLHLLERA